MITEPFAALLTIKWIGGAFFWVIKGFPRRFRDEIADKHSRRNSIAGYILEVIFLGLFVYLYFGRWRG